MTIYGFGGGAGAGVVRFLMVVEREVVDDVSVADGVCEPLVAGGRMD